MIFRAVNIPGRFQKKDRAWRLNFEYCRRRIQKSTDLYFDSMRTVGPIVQLRNTVMVYKRYRVSLEAIQVSTKLVSLIFLSESI